MHPTPHSDTPSIMQSSLVRQNRYSSCRQQSANSSVVSRKSTDKELLKREIWFLKEQVRRLSGGDHQRDRWQQQQQQQRSKPYQGDDNNINDAAQQRQTTSCLLQQPHHHTPQTSITFRVGRIVKNNPLILSQQKHPFNRTLQSRTLQARISKKNNKNDGVNNKVSSGSRVSNEEKGESLDGHHHVVPNSHELLFRQKVDNLLRKQEQQQGSNFDDQKRRQTSLSFDQALKSAQLTLPLNHENDHNTINPTQIHKTRQFSKSTTLNPPPQNPSSISKAQTDQSFLGLANPEYQEEPQNRSTPGKQANIRRITYKMLGKEKLNGEFDTIQGTSRKGLQQQQGADNFQTVKVSTIFSKRSFKSRLMSKSKMSAISHMDEEMKHRLQGKILKNSGRVSVFTDQQLSPNPQPSITASQIPTYKFSLTQLPFFAQHPHPKSNHEQITTLLLSIINKLPIPALTITRQSLMGIVIKKFKNCLIFTLPHTNKKVIWYYQGRFYLGQGEKQGEEGYKSGEGVEFCPGEYLYKGQFSENRRHGSGVMVRKEGRMVYEGQWERGREHGRGKGWDREKGWLYEGDWSDGRPEGYGVMKLSQTQVYKGTITKGMVKHGYGTQTFKNGDSYTGEYHLNKFHGKGTYTWSNGSFYSGQFVNGLRTGQGRWQSSCLPLCDMYIGSYLSDRKHGLGRYCWRDGAVYEGCFDNDEKHGEGVLVYRDGKSVRGKWERNRLVEVLDEVVGGQTGGKEDIDEVVIEEQSERGAE